MERLKRSGIEYKTGEALASGALKSAVERWAAETARTLNFKAGDSVEEIVHRLGGRIHLEGSLVFAEEDATIVVHGKNDFDIALTVTGSPRRNRFTLAHEIGHYLLHSQQGTVPLTADRKGSNRLEWEANWFAAGFLMPEEEFRRLYNQGMRDSRVLAAHFRVSEAAADVRKQSLGLT